MPIYRLYADERGATHLEPLSTDGLAFESGPGEFKGIGGSVLGRASRLMLMRFEPGAGAALHRVNPGFAVLLEGVLTVAASDGGQVELRPGDAVRIESADMSADGQGGWAPANPGPGVALLALTQMPAAEP